MKSLKDLHHTIERYRPFMTGPDVASVLAQLIEYLMIPRQMILYYPPGESMWNGQVTPNSVIAKLFLEACRGGADVALPEGWELKPVDEVVGVTAKENPDFLPPFEPCKICGGGDADIQRVHDNRVCSACWNAGKRL